MISRRDFVTGLASTLPLFYIGRSFADTGKEIERIVSSLPQLHTIQVRRGSDIVFATASGGRSFDRTVNIKSCSKSLLGLLLGAAIDKGQISNVRLPLSQVMPHILPKDVLPEVANITLEELVTLTAPLESTSIRNYGRWVNSSNWINYALRRPASEHSPGEMIYSTGATHILGVAMAEATGQNLLSQARTQLGEPIGISFPFWTRDLQGYYFGGNEMSLSPRAMLDITTMVRDDDVFRGKQVISKEWIAASEYQPAGSEKPRSIKIFTRTTGITRELAAKENTGKNRHNHNGRDPISSFNILFYRTGRYQSPYSVHLFTLLMFQQTV